MTEICSAAGITKPQKYVEVCEVHTKPTSRYWNTH